MNIDSRIPNTLEEAKALTNLRFFEWDEECMAIVQKLLENPQLIEKPGKLASVDRTSSIYKDLSELAENKLDDTNLYTAIPQVAAIILGV
ncbi:hypothetical protein CAL7716_085510 [Calothrix sp. PCC 7716]|nr:hypothetical protein CAL7716_085510 [Calothrix sp. PCC 7716]